MPTVYPSTLADIDASEGVLPPAYNFLANYRESGVSLETVWSTSILSAESVAEERQALIGRPVRTMTALLSVLQKTERWAHEMLLHRMAQAEGMMPLYPDMAVMTGAASGNVLPCDATSRRFFPGGRLIAVRPVRGSRQLEFGYCLIVSVADGSITVDGTWTGTVTLAKGTRLYPVFETRLIPTGQIGAQNAFVSEATVTVLERLGRWTLPALCTPGTVPSGFNTFGGLPILHLKPKYSELRFGPNRVVTTEQIGRDQYMAAYGSPRFTFECAWTFVDRATAFQLLSFFDSRAGRTYPFILPHPMATFEFLGGIGKDALSTDNGTWLESGFLMANGLFGGFTGVGYTFDAGDLLEVLPGSPATPGIYQIVGVTGGGDLQISDAPTISGTRRASELATSDIYSGMQVRPVSRGIRVRTPGHLSDWDRITMLAVRYPGNAADSVVIYDIEDVLSDGTTDTVLLDGVVDPENIRSISPAHRVRFDSDAIRERWLNGRIVDVNTVITEAREAVIGCQDGDVMDPSTLIDAVVYDTEYGCFSTDGASTFEEGGDCETVQGWDPAGDGGNGSGSGTMSISGDTYRKRVAFWHPKRENGTVLKQLGESPNFQNARPVYNSLTAPGYAIRYVNFTPPNVDCPYWDWVDGDPWKVLNPGHADANNRRDAEAGPSYMYSSTGCSLGESLVPGWHTDGQVAGYTIFVLGGNRWFSPNYYESAHILEGTPEACGLEGLSSGVYDDTDSTLLEILGAYRLSTGGLSIEDGAELTWAKDAAWKITSVLMVPGLAVGVYHNGVLKGQSGDIPEVMPAGTGYVVCGEHARMRILVVIPRAISTCEHNAIGRYLAALAGLEWTTIE